MTTAAQTLPPLYKKPEPLVAATHKTLKIAATGNFNFARHTNSVILTVAEVSSAAMSYPVVFSQGDDDILPVAVLGLEENENAFVDSDGGWRANTYIPAYIRRYPFIFMETPDTDVLTLCVDMAADVIGTKKGELIFKGEKPTAAGSKALEFCNMFNQELVATKALGKLISEAGLLDDKEATLTDADGKKTGLKGFRVIDEERLNALDETQFLALRKAGALPVIYSHLLSMNSWNNVLG